MCKMQYLTNLKHSTKTLNAPYRKIFRKLTGTHNKTKCQMHTHTRSSRSICICVWRVVFVYLCLCVRIEKGRETKCSINILEL